MNIGKSDTAAIGGLSISGLSSFDFSSFDDDAFFFDAGPNLIVKVERPDIIGGGNSMPSAAFLDNCLAKSDACHHSKNFNANMLVGSNIFKLPNNLLPSTLGFIMLVTPKLLPAVPGFVSAKAVIAL